jgi:serine/threonine-protein kinase HipA
VAPLPSVSDTFSPSAMAVGDNRHYRINTIAPRHFLQSAQHAGVGEEIVHSIFGELRETGQEAIARTLDRLPARFPKEVPASIQAGFLRRLELIERT